MICKKIRDGLHPHLGVRAALFVETQVQWRGKTKIGSGQDEMGEIPAFLHRKYFLLHRRIKS